MGRKRWFFRLGELLLIASAMGFLTTAPSHAALLAYEGFSYPAGATVVGQGTNTNWPASGQSWTGVSTATLETPGSDFNYHGLAHTGNVVDIKGLNEGIYRKFGQTYITASGVYWVSVVLDVDSNVANAYAGLSLYSSTDPNRQEKFFLGQDNLNTNWSMELSANSDRGVSTTPIQPETSALLVLELDGPDNIAKLFVNPTSLGGNPPATPSATLSLTGNQFLFDEIRIQSGGTQEMDADEFRLGKTFADVTPLAIVPEPASWTLFVVGLCAVPLIRRSTTKRPRCAGRDASDGSTATMRWLSCGG